VKAKKYVELEGYNTTIKDLRNEIKLLKEKLNEKPSDDTNAAKYALSKCTEYKNRSEEAKVEIDKILSDISTKKSSISTLNETITTYNENIKSTYQQSIEVKKELEQLENKINVVDRLFNDKQNLENKLDELTDYYNNSTDLSNKINALYKSIQERKNEIDQLYYEIYGYEEPINDNEEETNYIAGLKDKLKESYNKIQKDIKLLEESIANINDETSEKYEDFLNTREEQYKSLVKDIEDLLPRALTAGLSHAYARKRITEKTESKKLEKQFENAIKGLIVFAFIPFGVSIYLLATGQELVSAIKDMPSMVFSILPLYIPIVWFAYSSSKKLNLSKRLIEEYTHKEVLSKTFEGLSTQIENIEDNEISSELKIKLLYNILSVSSENPGKLISDYNKAGHPLIDALDKSAKLSDAVESISKIPGLSKLTKILDEKAKKINKQQEDKINDALDATEQKI
jgi:small-conductance mechanosensitive channel